MKAVVWTAYGGPEVLRVEEVENPVPGDSEVLIAVGATTITAGDVEIRSFAFRNVLTIPLRLSSSDCSGRGASEYLVKN